MYSELIDKFYGLPVKDYEEKGWASKPWPGPKFAYRVRSEYDADTLDDRLDGLLEQADVDQLQALIIGAWDGACEGEGAAGVVSKLVDNASSLPNLRALFVGEMTYEECEISWINQTDLSPLLEAFPRLEVLRVRGGTGLSFSRVQHSALRELAIETGGLPRSVVREIFLCEFPALERLELLFGEENYGFDGGVEDLQPLLSGGLFPSLKHLGLMNSSIANEIAAVVVNSPIVDGLETLDLSMGNLDGEGVKSLSGLGPDCRLKTLNISHHYASEAEVHALAAALPCAVIADDPQQPDDEWRGVLHAE